MPMRLLWGGARGAQRKVMASNDICHWSKDDQELWDLTVLEAQAGNLAGPFSPEELEAQGGKL